KKLLSDIKLMLKANSISKHSFIVLRSPCFSCSKVTFKDTGEYNFNVFNVFSAHSSPLLEDASNDEKILSTVSNLKCVFMLFSIKEIFDALTGLEASSLKT